MEYQELREELQKKVDQLLEAYSHDLGVPSSVSAIVEVASYIAKLSAPTKQLAEDVLIKAVSTGLQMGEES